VIIDHTNRRVLDVLESREKDCVVEYLRQGKEGGLLAGVVEVTCDMWDAYANAATEVFGTGCRVVIDRFHVMKNFQEQLTDARREIQRGLGKEEAKALKGTRWLWVKNWENLTEQDRVELEDLKKRFPPLKQLAEQRESLRAIFEDKEIRSVEEGRKRLEAWMAEAGKLALKGLKAFCKTLTNWMGKIAGYFVTRSSNGRTEGFNHGLRSILWRAFGMTNFRRFRLRVLDRFGRPATT
jgi:transposase